MTAANAKVRVSPNEAVHILAPRLGGIDAAKAVISGRIREGNLAAQATAFQIMAATLADHNAGLGLSLVSEKRSEKGTIGLAFWGFSTDWRSDVDRWGWATGHFDVRQISNGQIIVYSASGVTFPRSQIDILIPGGSQRSDGRVNSGVSRSEKWNDWIAELVVCNHNGLIDATMTTKKVSSLIDERIRSLAEEQPDKYGYDLLGEETVRAAVRTTLKRLREDDQKK